MFDAALCDRPLPAVPIFVEWLKSLWFNKQLLVAIVVLVLFGLYWILKQKRWRRQLTSAKTSLLLLAGTATLAILFAMAPKALVAFLPADPGTVVDRIVILGRGPLMDEERVNLATELWQAKRAPKIFVSGRGDAKRTIELLEAKGIPKQVLDGENCSTTTLENAIFSSAVLKTQKIQKILLITDPPHMLRSLLVFRTHGFSVIPRTSTISPYFFGKKGRIFLTLREYTGLFNYALRGLFHQNEFQEINKPEVQEIIQKAEQYGRQQRQ